MENQFIIPGFIIAVGVDEKSVILKEPNCELKTTLEYPTPKYLKPI